MEERPYINPDNTSKIEGYCSKNNLKVVGKILYDPQVTKAMVRKKSVIEYPCGEVSKEITGVWEKVEERLRHREKQCRERKDHSEIKRSN